MNTWFRHIKLFVVTCVVFYPWRRSPREIVVMLERLNSYWQILHGITTLPLTPMALVNNDIYHSIRCSSYLLEICWRLGAAKRFAPKEFAVFMKYRRCLDATTQDPALLRSGGVEKARQTLTVLIENLKAAGVDVDGGHVDG